MNIPVPFYNFILSNIISFSAILIKQDAEGDAILIT